MISFDTTVNRKENDYSINVYTDDFEVYKKVQEAVRKILDEENEWTYCEAKKKSMRPYIRFDTTVNRKENDYSINVYTDDFEVYRKVQAAVRKILDEENEWTYCES